MKKIAIFLLMIITCTAAQAVPVLVRKYAGKTIRLTQTDQGDWQVIDTKTKKAIDEFSGAVYKDVVYKAGGASDPNCPKGQGPCIEAWNILD